MASRPVVLVHGYSDSDRGFVKWRDILTGVGAQPVYDVRVVKYESLSNEISIKDIAEGFDRALRYQAGLDKDEDFDAIVHSTGMLVIRAWMTTYAKRRDRLKHLVAFAPATWGSPLAHKGRSWLGSIFKGDKNPLSPDFFEAGNEVLSGLELGSRFTWDLAHKDLFVDDPFYGPSKKTPYVFIFCGNKPYTGIRELVNEPGTDGTVRLAGCSLNSRKVVVDLTERADGKRRVAFAEWKGVSEIPVVLIEGLNHGTIMGAPTAEMVDLVREGLEVSSENGLAAWNKKAKAVSAEDGMKKKWQQFVLRMVDERGDPITDYNVRIWDGEEELKAFTEDVHVYAFDKSLRNFHVDVTKLVGRKFNDLRMQIVASSGTKLIGYVAFAGGQSTAPEATIDISLDLTALVNDPKTNLFFPYTTTVIELRLDREPMPIGSESDICKIVWPEVKKDAVPST
jgi:pimeloyl-ACP methyl ester carboxylesterase